MPDDAIPVQEAKRKWRARARQLRRQVADRPGRSLTVWSHLREAPLLRRQGLVAAYVSTGEEVDTRILLHRWFARGRPVALPYCRDDGLGLVLVRAWDELEMGRYGILEPRVDLRDDPQRMVQPQEVEFFLVPALAVDPCGTRLGRGGGYYDRLLAQAPDVPRCAVVFACQIFPRLPRDQHDVLVQWVASDLGVHPAQ